MNFKENMIRERQQARENFLAYEEGWLSFNYSCKIE